MPTLSFDGLLFDMDGTLVDSTLAVEGAWASFKDTYPHFDIPAILEVSHGIRTEENLRRLLPDLSEREIQNEAARFEEEIVNSAQKRAAAGRNSFVPLPGVEQIVSQLAEEVEPQKWAICTSATRVYASRALPLAGIPVPTAFVTADDVSQGKPNPAPYLRGAEKIGVPPSKCLVFEDAPAGITSGKAAGSTVLALLTTHSKESVEAAKPDFILQDLSQCSIARQDGVWKVTIPESASE